MVKTLKLYCACIGFLFLIACTTDSNKNEQWVYSQHGLWESKITGDLAIKTKKSTERKPNEEDKYIIYSGVAGDGSDPKIKNIIDKWSFRQVAKLVYKDKNHVYYHRPHSDGGFFYPIEADSKTFEMIGESFAKDKNHIYYFSGSSGAGIIDVDYDSFKTCFGCASIGKDKNNIYFLGKKVEPTEIKDDEAQKIFEYLQQN